MKKLILFFIFTVFIAVAYGQTSNVFLNTFEQIKEPTIKDKYYTHKDVVSILDRYKNNPLFEISQIGESIEKRSIFQVKMGNGDTKLLLWAQMHGDEPTPTASVLDVMRFFADKDPAFKSLKDSILNNLTLVIIPMLNPDGADRVMRRNAQDIDINRDALNLETPEAKILRSIHEKLEPHYGYNLHDQNKYYGFTENAETSAIALLAPRPNEEGVEVENHLNSKRLLVYLNQILQKHIPNKVGKFKDEFTPDAFGELFQSLGTTTILIEGGYIRGDEQKQKVRKIHFMLLMESFISIMNDSHVNMNTDDYYDIPLNKSHFCDLIVRNCILPNGNTGDIAFKRSELRDSVSNEIYTRSRIHKIGSLHEVHGYTEYNAKRSKLSKGKVYPQVFKSNKISTEKQKAILRKGYTDIIVKGKLLDADRNKLLLTIHSELDDFDGNTSNYVLKQNGKVRLAVINGTLIEVK